MRNLFINEAFAAAAMAGRKLSRKELCGILFPAKSYSTARVNLRNLASGKVKRVTAEELRAIRKYLGCTYEQLIDGFGTPSQEGGAE